MSRNGGRLILTVAVVLPLQCSRGVMAQETAATAGTPLLDGTVSFASEPTIAPERMSSGALDRRALLESNVTAVRSFSLLETLNALAINDGLVANGQRLYHELVDSYASAPGRLASAIHCNDQTTNGKPSLNGYPISCDRLEAQQFDNLAKWFPISVANRLDLAPENGAHCGQQRISFANTQRIGEGRMFIIVEARVPNPRPDLGIAGCRPVAEFWRQQRKISSPRQRGERLHRAFITGEPTLSGAGFKPFMSATNMTVGSGQLRTNNFNSSPWTLREFKTLKKQDGALQMAPFPVAHYGVLWNDAAPLPFGELCRASFLNALPDLMMDNVGQMAFTPDARCKGGESINDDYSDDFPGHLARGNPQGFMAVLAERLAGTGLTPMDVAARARFSASCIGCHEEANGLALGRGVVAPRSGGFVHVDEKRFEDCGDGTRCYALSPALRNAFLPFRAEVVRSVLSQPAAVQSAGAAPPQELVTVPAADTALVDLVEADERAKDAWGERTVGGRAARVTH